MSVESTRSLVGASTTMAFVGSRSRIVVSLVVILMSASTLLMGSRVTVVLSALVVGMVLIPVLGVPIVGVFFISLGTRLVMTSGMRSCVVPIGGDITSN